MSTQAVILLTFSNDSDDYLSKIVAEQKAIKQALLDVADKNYVRLRDVQRVSTEEVFYLINRYHNRVSILHYAGHADGQSLQLEQEVGVVQSANVKGIAGLLGTQQELQLVFLNGCATKGQVKALLDSGVKAVIATNVKINDDDAFHFASQFYQALASGNTIRESFQKARAFIETRTEHISFRDVAETRGILMSFEHTSVDEMPWGLYWKPEAEAVLDWKLPTTSPLELNFATDSIASKRDNPINSFLVDSTLKAVRESEHVKELARKINKERQAGNASRCLTDAEKKNAIVRAYLTPISVQLRALFSKELSEKMDKERLQQLLNSYQKAVELFAFVLLSNIWDATQQRTAPLDLNEADRLQLQAFFDLNTYTVASFDYFPFIDALLLLAQRNGIQLYLETLNTYTEGWTGKTELAKVQAHFQLMKTALEGDIPSHLIESYCIVSEQQLALVLTEWSFLIHYKMAVIKNIEVQQLKNMPPTTFKHVMVDLDNNYSDVGNKDRHHALDKPTDMESVLLYQEQLNDSLNLSPFILDENALTREYNSKIYFFSHRSEEGLHYHWIENDEDEMIISSNRYDYILQQFEQARRDILDEQAVETKAADIANDDDIMSLM